MLYDESPEGCRHLKACVSSELLGVSAGAEGSGAEGNRCRWVWWEWEPMGVVGVAPVRWWEWDPLGGAGVGPVGNGSGLSR